MDGEVEGIGRAGRLGPYELRGELGRGAMARVWRAWDPNLGREVAIKEPLFGDGLAEQVRADMASRFVKEARTAAGLNHPNIVTIYAADVYDDRPCIVMELVDGVTLGEMLESGPLSPQASLDVLDQLLDAVGYAHDKGVVHRDIKPDNIFVDGRGHAKLSDFGIAHAEGAATHATVAGTVLGTPGYMSPEQAQGRDVDATSDLFSVGVVAYEMLTGRNPFGAGDGSDPVTLLYRIVHEPAPELPDVVSTGLPADVRPAIMAALSKDPGARPQTAQEFKAMLHGGVATQAAGTGAAEVVRRAGKRSGWMPYAIVGAACVAALAIAFFAMGGFPASGGASTPQVAPVTASGSSAVASGASEPGVSASEVGMYYLAVKDGKVAIYANSSAEPYRVTDVQASDLGSDAAADVDAHVSFDSVADAENQVDAYRAEVAASKEEARRKADEEEEARRKAEEEQRKADEERRKAEEGKRVDEVAAKASAESGEQTAARMVASLDGWWHAPFQNNIYCLIEDGTFTIYRPDYPAGVFYRTVSASDLVRCEDGLPGHFAGEPGYLIPYVREGDKNYYITDADFEDNGKIDTISHINSDGSGYVEDETFSRSSRPGYAQ